MPRPMSVERQRAYEELHAYLDFYSTHVWEIDPRDPKHPRNVVERIIAEYGKAKAFEGLMQAVNDTLEELTGRPADFVQNLDAKLREHGLLTVSEVRRRYASSYRRILNRGSIANETEYYLVAGVLAALDPLADSSERKRLENMILDYEQRA